MGKFEHLRAVFERYEAILGFVAFAGGLALNAVGAETRIIGIELAGLPLDGLGAFAMAHSMASRE